MRPLQVTETSLHVTAGGRSAGLVRSGLIGTAAGILSGLFGVGGGIVLVPALIFLARMDARRAAATSLAAVIPIAASGLVGYASGGQVDWVVAAVLTTAAVVGSAIGTRLLRLLPERTLMLAFAVLLVGVAVRMFFQTGEAGGRGAIDVALVLGVVAVGLFTGILSGLFGVGGGFVIVPALILLFSEPSTVAKGTSLLAILPTAVVGSLINARHHLVQTRHAAAVGVAGAAFSFVTARFALGLDEKLANMLFAILLLAVAARMFLSARR